MADGDETTMHIGELAERAGMSLRTLRHYDEVGLLRPSGRTDGGFRLYTEHDFERLMLIRRMKPLGYSLERMGELLATIDEPGRAGVAAFIAEAEERRATLEKHLGWADEFLVLLLRRSGTSGGSVASRASRASGASGASGSSAESTSQEFD